jgi:hypothetical protein
MDVELEAGVALATVFQIIKLDSVAMIKTEAVKSIYSQCIRYRAKTGGVQAKKNECKGRDIGLIRQT